MNKIVSILSSIGTPVFAITWIIAMINLWKWNSESTGIWFAFAMVFLGFVVLFFSIAHTFNLWDKLKKRKQNKNKN